MSTQEPAAGDGGGLVRVRLHLAYDGAGFAGWARQPGLRTVQDCVEVALARCLRVVTPNLTCAGRTDAGVHARGQVAHVDVARAALEAVGGRSPQDWPGVLSRRLNRALEADVRVHGCERAPSGFDARFSALWRRYSYRVCDDAAQVDPLLRRHVWIRPGALDLAAMNAAATGLKGMHDFAAYCRARDGGTTVRDLHELTWERDRDRLAVLQVQADAFCHHLVRGLVGALLSVGRGRRPVGWPAELLTATARQPSVPVAPAHGLTLEEVGYPPDDQLAARAATTRARRQPTPTQGSAQVPRP